MAYSDIIVSILCTVYNQAKYLRECIDGILAQKTNFRYEVIIHDDASSDDSVEIIKEYMEKYPNLIFLVAQEENKFSKQKFDIYRNYLFPLVRGKYIAFCEADDYWIASDKLQKQVDFLEKNTDYGLVYTNYNAYIEKSKILKLKYGDLYKNFSGYAFEKLFERCFIRTLTVCVRSNLLINIPRLSQGVFNGDLFYFYEVTRQTKIYYDDFISGVYRILTVSSSHCHNLASWKEMHDSLRKLDYYEAQYLSTELELLKLDAKWLLFDLKYSLKKSDMNYFNSLRKTDKRVISYFPFRIRAIFLICQSRIGFNFLSWIIRKKMHMFS